MWSSLSERKAGGSGEEGEEGLAVGWEPVEAIDEQRMNAVWHAMGCAILVNGRRHVENMGGINGRLYRGRMSVLEAVNDCW